MWTIVEADLQVGLNATPPRFSAANGANRRAGNSSSSIARIRRAIDMAACRLRILFRRGRDWSFLDLAGPKGPALHDRSTTVGRVLLDPACQSNFFSCTSKRPGSRAPRGVTR